MSGRLLSPFLLADLTLVSVERVYLDEALGLLSIEHDGSIGWDEMQMVKNVVWGFEAVAIEVYPPAGRVVNNIAMRHLWLLGDGDWWPDLCREGPAAPSTLRERYAVENQRGGA